MGEQCRAAGVRVEVDSSGDRLGKMVRNAEKARVPVMAVVGAREVETTSLNMRTRSQGELGPLAVTEVIDRVSRAIASRDDF